MFKYQCPHIAALWVSTHLMFKYQCPQWQHRWSPSCTESLGRDNTWILPALVHIRRCACLSFAAERDQGWWPVSVQDLTQVSSTVGWAYIQRSSFHYRHWTCVGSVVATAEHWRVTFQNKRRRIVAASRPPISCTESYRSTTLLQMGCLE